MADPDNEDLDLNDEVEANLAIEQGLGVGARELAAQRDPGGVITADEEPELADEADAADAEAEDAADAVMDAGSEKSSGSGASEAPGRSEA